ncbi:MAG: tRNA uridine-5-carboxymethylaminomethyl(34) synthesis enzyme MnmG [Planctomycetota bacterium]|nr:tRNA uridine-5-carboxymethylaminomethyl(34) synthesis enzyme MnmG [Planctomycetota bacterium]
MTDDTMAAVVVVGGGHAGCEAALASARMGQETVLVTLEEQTIGALSCNPAIGGVGKGQLTREIDALGGAQGIVTDLSGIHYRMLNTSKGEAVQSLRAQVDKELYSRQMRHVIENQSQLRVFEGSVEDIHVEGDRAAGVKLADGSVLRSSRVILTNGTFLRAVMHVGDNISEGGRAGEGSVAHLTGALGAMGLETGRLKTGTPPRLDRDSIDWDRLSVQVPDQNPDGFSHWVDPPRRDWMNCHITRTDESVHEVIREHLHRSAMYSGQIDGIGPRYCPSIEDKVVRFPERSGHIIHLEREGLETNSIYVNGVSTSLPADAQEQLVARIPGLENARFLRHGYAVEYDFFPPHQIRRTFECRAVSGLYLAGQICGTSGYEEAAAQGFLAGVNAALSLAGEPPFILGRDEAYMGVLADDLVRCDPREPYRMFTSRAEYRLMLRHDNADLRLATKGEALGLIDSRQADAVRADKQKISETICRLHDTRIGTRTLHQRMRIPGTTWEDVEKEKPEIHDWQLEERLKDRIRVAVRYEAYIERQMDEVERTRRQERWQIPDDIQYETISGLRSEAREKLIHLRPDTVASARRIAGVSPADLSCLLVALRARIQDEDLEPV